MSEDGEGRREVLARQNERRPSNQKCPMSHRVRGRCLVAGGEQLRLIGGTAENRYNSSPYAPTVISESLQKSKKDRHKVQVLLLKNTDIFVVVCPVALVQVFEVP